MKLLEPITIRGVEFKNRIVMAPMQVGVGMRGRRARNYYLERARGGVGTVIMAGTSVDVFASDEAWGRAGGVEDFINSMRPFTDDFQKLSVKIGIQLWHGNQFPAGTGAPGSPQGELVGPSPADDGRRELTVPEIKTIISRFAQASAGARRAGFDFIEVHGAHGYLVCQFFSPATNKRHDNYGGDLSGRMRFGTECVSAIREAVGDDFPVFYRIGAWEDLPGGITTDDSVRFSAGLEKAGADAIHVSLGATTGTGMTSSPGPDQPEAAFVSLAEAIKHQVKIPVIAVGRFKTPQVAEDTLAQGKADMIALGRQLIADPYWAEKVAGGRAEDIIPCISCNNCFLPIRTGVNLRCSVNAVTGSEGEFTIEPASKPKKVMVVGGGPAGMEAARVAALRGHKVTLYEKQSELGGQLLLAAVPPYKHELASLNSYLVHQLEKTDARVKLGVEVTPDEIEKERPDALVISAGSVPMTPEIPGIDTGRVVNAGDVLSGKATVGERVVVIGGELVGCETADFLSRQGKKVTVLRRGPEMATKVNSPNRQALLARLRENGVSMITGIARYEAITEDGLVIVDGDGKQRMLEADTVVLAAGAVPDDRLAKAIAGKVAEVHLAGDCARPGRILEAIHDGSRIGREI